MVKTTLASVIEKKEVQDRCLLKLNTTLDFRPGQFITIILDTGEEKTPRPYSITSLPNKNPLELYIKRIKNGKVSNYLCDLKKGDTVKFTGPLGKFTLENSTLKNKVFIAVGTGIAPLRSMINYLIKDPEENIELIYGNRDYQTFFFHNEFKNLEKNHKNFTYHPILSRPEPSWKGKKGYIQEILEEIKLENREFYICGSKNAAESAKELLLRKKISPTKIFLEEF